MWIWLGRWLIFSEPSIWQALVPIVLAFSQQELTEPLYGEVFIFEVENYRLSFNWLLGRVANASEYLVLEECVEGASEVRVEDQDSLQEVYSLRGWPGILLMEVGTWLLFECFQVLKGFWVRNEVLIGLSGCANDLEDKRKLVILAEWEAVALLCLFIWWRQWKARFAWK